MANRIPPKPTQRRPPIHNHAIVIASCVVDHQILRSDNLVSFLRKLITDIKMHVLIEPTVQYGAYGYTGLAGIVTSHIAFHFFEEEQVLHLDVYSCKAIDLPRLMMSLQDFWSIQQAEVLFIQRDRGPKIEKFHYESQVLKPVSLDTPIPV